MHSTVAQVLVIWFIASTVAAMSLGAVLQAVSAPTPLPLPERAYRPISAPRRDAMVGCGSRR